MATDLHIDTVYRVRINNALHEFGSLEEAESEVRRLTFAASLTEFLLHLQGNSRTCGENALRSADQIIATLCQYRAGFSRPGNVGSLAGKLACLDTYKDVLEAEELAKAGQRVAS